MAYENLDLRLFTEVDGLGRYIVNESRVTCSLINNQMSQDIHVYYNWYENQTSFGNWSIEYEFKTPTTDADDSNAFCVHLGLANSHDSLGDLMYEQWCGFHIGTGGTYPVTGILGDWNGVQRQKTTAQLNENTVYYANLSRFGSVLNFSIYSDVGRTTLVADANYTSAVVTEWRYMMVAQSYDYPPSSQSVDSYWTQKYNITYVANFSDWGNVEINVFNENTSAAISNWDILISDEDGINEYYNTSQNNPLTLFISELPFENNMIIKINKTGFCNRVFNYDFLVGNEYTLNVFLSDVNYTNLYYVTVTDSYGSAVNDATVTIQKYINGNWENITILKTNGFGQINAQLQVGWYKIKIEKNGYLTKINYFETDPDFYGLYYPMSFIIYQEDTDPNVYTFTDLIDLNCSWQNNNTLGVFYDDNSQGTWILNITVYQNQSIYKASYNFTSTNTKTVYVPGLDYNYSHRVIVDINHSLLGDVENYTIFIMPKRSFTIDTTDIVQHLEDSFGNFDLGYVATFFVYAPGMIILLGFAAIKQPGIGIMGLAFWSAFTASKIETSLEENLYVLFSLLVLLGILAYILRKRGGSS